MTDVRGFEILMYKMGTNTVTCVIMELKGVYTIADRDNGVSVVLEYNYILIRPFEKIGRIM